MGETGYRIFGNAITGGGFSNPPFSFNVSRSRQVGSAIFLLDFFQFQCNGGLENPPPFLFSVGEDSEFNVFMFAGFHTMPSSLSVVAIVSRCRGVTRDSSA